MGRLTAVAVRNLRHDPAKGAVPIRINDGGGLYLQVAPGNAKSWVFRYKLGGRERWMGLGSAEHVSLAEARALAAEARRLLAAGRDPIEERERERQAADAEAVSFEQAARALVAAKRAGWRSEKHAKQWLSTLGHAFPVIGQRPVGAVETADVLAVLQPLWQRVPETASRLRQRIEAVLDFATAQGWRPAGGANPARWRGHLAAILPPPRRVKPVRHVPALPWQDVPAFMAALAEREGMAAQAVAFAILTASRSGAVRLMRWREVDFEARVWIVPPANMKAGRLHRVPLADAAMTILEALRPLASDPDRLVFPSARAGRPLSDMALSMLVRGMACDGLADGEPPRWRDAEGRAITVHGFRSAFKAWSLAAGWPDHLSEAALAHADRDKVRAAYARGDLLEERRPMMQAWADHCLGRRGAVVPLAPARTSRALP